MGQALAQNPPNTQKGTSFVKDVANAEQNARVQRSSEYYNLVESLDPAVVKSIGKEIFDGYKTDDESRKNWLEMHEFWFRLYMQTDSAVLVDADRDWGATESVPVLMESCDQFQSRCYKAFFPNQTFVSAAPIAHTNDPEKHKMLADRAERVGRHMSWQLGIKNKNYRKDKRALMLGVALHGSFFTKTYFNTENNSVCVDNIRPTDLVVNYNVGAIRMEDLRRKSHVIYTSVGAVQDLYNKKWLSDTVKPNMSGSQTQYNSAVDEADGLVAAYARSKRDQPVILIEQQFYYDIENNGNYLPYIGTIDGNNGKLLRLTIDYDADPQGNPTNNYKQIQYYTHYKYSENPDGFYGLGLGHKIGDLNSAINIGMRQTLDAATLANDGNNSGYISERLVMDGAEEVTMTLGKLKKVPDSSGDIQNGIMMMKFGGPSDILLKMIEMLDQRAQRIASTTEVTTGSVDSNMQPTTVLAQIEQAMEMFSSVQMGLADSLGDELSLVYKINQKHLPFVEYFSLNDEPNQITRLDYSDDMMILPVFDPKFATQMQKVQRAQSIAQIVMANPLTQQRPEVMDELTRMNLEAIDADGIDLLVPPPPPPPANINDQIQENMMFLMPDGGAGKFDVYPDQSHAQHLMQLHDFIAKHGDLIQDPKKAQAIQEHKQKHEAFLYGQENGIIPPSSPKPSGIGGMAQQPSNQMVAQPAQ